jgi:hypothetical protein
MADSEADFGRRFFRNPIDPAPAGATGRSFGLKRCSDAGEAAACVAANSAGESVKADRSMNKEDIRHERRNSDYAPNNF